MRFFCVNDGVQDDLVAALREACRSRGIEWLEVNATRFTSANERPGPGDLMYRPAVSLSAIRAEQILYSEAVATFYAGPHAVYFGCGNATLYFGSLGLPVPPTEFVVPKDHGILREQVERLGGFPVIVKALGYSGGDGVVRVESYPTLFSVVDLSHAQGNNPLMMASIDGALHWRVVVLGEGVQTAYRNTPRPNDFRTWASSDPADYGLEPPAPVADAAVRATAALGLEFAGVDVLETPDGAPYVLEANFPCYFNHPYTTARIDVAGPMIEYLAEKARRLHPELGEALQVTPAPAPGPPPPRVEVTAKLPPAAKLHERCTRPRLVVVDDFATPEEVAHVRAVAANPGELRARNIEINHDKTGWTFEMPINGDPVLESLRERIHGLIGHDSDVSFSFRFRRYVTGESHPLHSDMYEINGSYLIATALVYLNDTEEGGETHFPNADPEPLRVRPREGRLAAWRNCTADGVDDARAEHESLAVTRGTKEAIAYFLYKDRAFAGAELAPGL